MNLWTADTEKGLMHFVPILHINEIVYETWSFLVGEQKMPFWEIADFWLFP